MTSPSVAEQVDRISLTNQIRLIALAVETEAVSLDMATVQVSRLLDAPCVAVRPLLAVLVACLQELEGFGANRGDYMDARHGSQWGSDLVADRLDAEVRSAVEALLSVKR